MSGGVDSSVAAALLVDQGYEVIGIMMRLWSEPGNGTNPVANRCCTPDQMADARRIADQLNIPFYVLDSQETFRQVVVQYYLDEHARGRTPNPCIACNRQIRFTYLLNQALALNANYLATGHYARIRQAPSGYQLLKGLDEAKDQSYVLHILTQEKLAHTLFPIGAYTKVEVRKLAKKFELPVAQKADSQDLCFLKDGDYRRFLRDHSPDLPESGPIIDKNGRILGQHEGLPYYTIGQRKGLNISAPQPLYVLEKVPSQKALIVGSREQLGNQELTAAEVNWVAGIAPETAVRAQVKIRYKAKGIEAEITPLAKGRVRVNFDEPALGITPGQGAVFYDGEVCLGGGIIQEANK